MAFFIDSYIENKEVVTIRFPFIALFAEILCSKTYLALLRQYQIAVGALSGTYYI